MGELWSHLVSREEVGAAEVLQRFTQGASGEDAAIAKHIERIHKDHIQVPVELPMLVAIIEDNDFSLEFVDSILTCNARSFPMTTGIPGSCFAMRNASSPAS